MPKQVTNVAADDALTTIYRIAHDEGDEVIAARVAERLEITPASIAGMLSRLTRDRLVTVDAKKRISLTPGGLDRAEEMVRRHRLAECLLVNVMGLEWWRGYEEAHLMEHSISDVTEPLIFRLLGAPEVSPFGYPIPGSDGGRRPLSHRRLCDVGTGEVTRVQRVYEEDEELLQFFDREGIRPGVKVEVKEVAVKRGTLTVAFDGRPVVLGRDPARRIWVEA